MAARSVYGGTFGLTLSRYGAYTALLVVGLVAAVVTPRFYTPANCNYSGSLGRDGGVG